MDIKNVIQVVSKLTCDAEVKADARRTRKLFDEIGMSPFMFAVPMVDGCIDRLGEELCSCGFSEDERLLYHVGECGTMRLTLKHYLGPDFEKIVREKTRDEIRRIVCDDYYNRRPERMS